MTLEQQLEWAVSSLSAHVPGLEGVYLFGSAATGTTNAASDLDLAVLAARPMAPVFRWELQQALAAGLHQSVDLVDLRTASTVMCVQVLATGRLIYEAAGAAVARAWFEMVTLGRYARLNEERRAILADIETRGRVYG